jgi:hypothetical protein
MPRLAAPWAGGVASPCLGSEVVARLLLVRQVKRVGIRQPVRSQGREVGGFLAG